MLAALLALSLAGGCGRDRDMDTEADEPQQTATSAPPPPGAPPKTMPPTNDPRVALQNMAAAYRALDSLMLTTETDWAGPARIHQSCVYMYRRQPAGVSVTTSDYVSGTQQYMAGDGSLVYYKAVDNSYVRDSVPGDMAALSRRIDRLAPQILSPLDFLKGDDTLKGVGAARMAGTATVNGRQVYVIKGEFSPEFQLYLCHRIITNAVRPAAGEFTLWLDRNTYLIEKSFVRLTARKVSDNAEWRFEFTERVAEMVPNPAFSRFEFRFDPPKNAVLKLRSG
jgi:hypothetical protein